MDVIKKAFLVLCGAIFVPSVYATQMCPDGSYVANGPCKMCPDGKYIGGSGATCQMTPKGNYVPRVEGKSPQLMPNGTYIQGGTNKQLCPDGSYVAGTQCVMTPNGKYVGK